MAQEGQAKATPHSCANTGIKDQEMFDKMLEYIHLNPVIAGFVIKPEDWKYSSARDSSGMQGLIDLSYTS